MSAANELAALFQRDITRLCQELRQFPDDGMLWRTLPGVTNSAGNLALHLEGNLREYVGRQLGHIAYTRQRDLEFATFGKSQQDLVAALEAVAKMVPEVIHALSDAALDADFPEDVLGKRIPTRQFLIHLHGHLNYHLGQIDYLRRILASGTAVDFAGL